MSDASSIQMMLDDVTLDVEAENVGGVGAALLGVFGQLHAAGLAAASGVDLSLHHHRVADAIGDGDGVVDVAGGLAGRNRYAVFGEELLALIFE